MILLVKILKILEASSSRYMSPEDVYKSLRATGEEVGLATVYRVLNQIEFAGLVARHLEGGHPHFKMTLNEHVICPECGKVDESTQQNKQSEESHHKGYKFLRCKSCDNRRR